MNLDQNFLNNALNDLNDVIKDEKHWSIAWEIAKKAKENGYLELCDQACAIVLSKNPEFWFARELPKQARGYYGQNLQDLIIEQYFNERGAKCKFFVEVGAFDGVHYSNVRRLFEKYGWKGICIEPVTKNFQKLYDSYRNTDIICIHSAVSNFNGTLEMNVSTYPHLPDWGSDVASFSPTEKEKWTQRYGAVWQKETVKVRTLNDILSEYKVDELGFLSIDAEGHDLEVLMGIDLIKYKPDLILIESGDRRNEIIDYVTRFNYSLILDDTQDLFFAKINTIDDEISKSGFEVINYAKNNGKEPYVVIQEIVENQLDSIIGSHKGEIRNILIVGAYYGREIDNLLKNYPNAEIYAFEPNPKYFEGLEHKYSQNRKVHCYQYAVAKTDGWMEFYETNLEGSGSILPINDKSDVVNDYGIRQTEKFTVKTISLDNFSAIQGQKIDLIWIDVQGAELNVLEGAGNILQNTKCIFLEVWASKTLYKDQCRLIDLEKFLIRYGLILHSIGLGHSIGNGSGNAIFIRKDLLFKKDENSAIEDFSQIKNLINPKLFDINYLTEKDYKFCKTSHALDLLVPERFDIIAKYIYGYYILRNIGSDFAELVYKSHLYVLNQFDEDDFSFKKGYESFRTHFKNLLKSVQSVGFNENQTRIPIDKNGVIIDGSHRVATCLLLGIAVPVVVFDKNANIYDYKYFQNRRLETKYADFIAYHYAKLKKNTYIVTLFPSAIGYDDEVEQILRNYAKIVYHKKIEINTKGAINLIKQMYRDEKWLGNEENNFEGARYKAEQCYRHNGPTRVYLIETKAPELLVQAKTKIRDIYKIENHSVHINDKYDETLRLAQIYFNDNSIHFLNNASILQPARFRYLFNEYKKFLEINNVDTEYFCIDGSAVMSAYGIRDCRDLDYLHKGYENINYKDIEVIGSHNHEVSYHSTGIDNIIFNPDNHFYFDGIKFCSLKEIRNMKEKRGELKDNEDIYLIDYHLGNAKSSSQLQISASSIKRKKIVGLVPGRNEQIQIAQCLRCLAQFTDAIVYLDDCSDDDTLKIVKSLRVECNIERIIEKKTWERDEPKDRNDLLNAGREIGGTHFIVLDADEVLTSNLLVNNVLREAILNLQAGDIIKLNWIQLWRSTEKYRFDKSVWTYNYKDFIFCDDGNCFYSSDFIHTSRCPGNLKGKVYTLEGYDAGVLHFQFVNWRNLLIKQAWYRCLERIKNPDKDINEINQLYAPSKDERGIHLEPVRQEWFSYYKSFDKTIYMQPEHWRERQIIAWFNQYGKEFFKNLDIWDIDWNEDILTIEDKSSHILVSAIVSVYRAEKYIKDCLEDLVNQTLFKQGKLEIILIDSNSPEGEYEIIKEYLNKYPNIVYHRTDVRETVYQAWNRGIKLSRGEFITNANTDDRHKPDALEIMAKYLQEHTDVGIVYADCFVTDADNPKWNNNYSRALKWPEYNLRHLFDVCFLGPQPMWRKSLHDRYGYFNEEYESAGDYEFWLRIAVNGVKMLHIDAILGIYQENKDSISLSNLELNWNESEKARNKYWPKEWGPKPPTQWRSYEVKLEPKKSKRILIICDYFWPSVGGVELVAEDLAVSLMNYGHYIEIACRKLNNRESLLYKGIKINEFEGDNNDDVNKRNIEKENFIELCNKENFDVAIAISQPDNWVGEYLKAARNKPYLIYMPSINYDNFCNYRRQAYLFELYNRISIADKLIAVSENGWDAHYLRKMDLEYYFIPHGTHKNDKNIDFRSEFGISKNKPMILIVANFWPVKNHLEFFKYFKDCKLDCELVVIGNKISNYDIYFNECLKLAETDPRIKILGGLERQIASAAIRDADLLLVPSLGESAGPLVILQAMSYGTPWLATKHCNAVNDEAGGVVTNLENFNELIEVLFSKPQFLVELGKLGREHWERCFQWNKMMDAFLEIIDSGYTAKDFHFPEDIKKKNESLRTEILSYLKKNDEPKATQFSIIIPTYNRSEVLLKCLKSLDEMDYDSKDYEVIVVDDGSTDNTEEVVKSFRSRYTLKYFKKENGGPGPARNLGIKNASFEYLLILNDDAICYPDLLREHDKVHKLYPNQKISVLGAFPYKEKAQRKIFVYFLERSTLVFAYPMMKAGQLYNYRFFWTCNISIRKQAIIDAGLFDEDFREPMTEDTELGYRLQKMGYYVLYHPDAFTIHEHSMDIEGFAKRQKMCGRNVVLLFNKHPELLQIEKKLFGFDGLGPQYQEYFKNIIKRYEEVTPVFTNFFKEIEDVNPDGINSIMMPNGRLLNKNEIIAFLEYLASTIHTYWFHVGILEGIEKYGIPEDKNKEKSIHFSLNVYKKPKILFTMYGWNETGGGTIIPRSIAIRLARKGYEVGVFYAGLNHPIIKESYYFEKSNDSGVTLYGVFNRPILFTNGANPENEIRDEKIIEIYSKVLDDFKPDIVHYHNFIGLSFAIADVTKSKGIPSVYTPHNYHLMDPNLYMIENDLRIWKTVSLLENSNLIKLYPEKRDLYIERMIEARNLINKKIDYTLAISRRVKELLIDFGADGSRIAVVNQIPESCEMVSAKKSTDDIRLPLRAGFIGTVIPHKGVHIIAIAAQMIPEDAMQFYIYGFGNPRYIELIKNYDKLNRLNWMGEYRPQDLQQISQNLDLVIIPSIWEEGAGMVLPESLAMGLPVVAANIGGIPDYVKNEYNGVLYKYDSAIDLARILNDIAKNPGKLISWKNNCSISYKFDEFVDWIANIYRKLISKVSLNCEEISLYFDSVIKN